MPCTAKWLKTDLDVLVITIMQEEVSHLERIVQLFKKIMRSGI